MEDTIFECKCCGDAIGGTSDGRFGHDDRGPWRRIIGIDGPNAICPRCVGEEDALDHFISDGYDHVAIEVTERELAWNAGLHEYTEYLRHNCDFSYGFDD